MIETLESRQLLSAAPVLHHAAKVHPTPPAILDFSFTGTVTAKSGDTATASLHINSETKAGGLKASLIVDRGPASGTFVLKGTVNPKSKITVHGRLGKIGVTITGTISSDLSTLTGKYAATGIKIDKTGTVLLSSLVV
jgi:hypothetical protein